MILCGVHVETRNGLILTVLLQDKLWTGRALHELPAEEIKATVAAELDSHSAKK